MREKTKIMRLDHNSKFLSIYNQFNFTQEITVVGVDVCNWTWLLLRSSSGKLQYRPSNLVEMLLLQSKHMSLMMQRDPILRVDLE